VARQQTQLAAEARRSVRDESRLVDEVAAVVSLTAGVFSLISFFAYHVGSTSAQLAGRVGQGWADLMVQALGLSAYFVPAFLAIIALALFRQIPGILSVGKAAGASVMTVASAVLLALFSPAASERPVTLAGGWVGGFLAEIMGQAFGQLGALVIVGSLLLLCFLFVTQVSLSGVAGFASDGARGLLGKLKRISWKEKVKEKVEVVARKPSNVKKELPAATVDGPPPIVVLGTEERAPQKAQARPVPKRGSKAVQEELPFESDSNYQTPPIRLLDPPDHGAIRVDEEALHRSSQILVAKLADFGIEGRVVEVRPGPVITTFDIEPAPGVKVNRIVSLGDDLAMALRVPGVRILAPVPGKAVVGIEVANPRRDTVVLRELIESEPFTASPSSLALSLGKDTAGAAVVGDLARMPHLLVAGATGSGKSVAINAMIMSILYKAAPRDVRFVLIDMKMLELSVYEDIPHLLVPVVTDPKQVVAVLHNIVEQMEERYRLMKDRGVRNIDGYNRLVEQELADLDAGVIELTELVDDDAEEDEEDEVASVVTPPPRPERLPKIVVIIDELADLMMTMGRKVEEPITRLAQKARAAGIHLILATQRPSVDVITGLIKANFPARISFQTTARVDSRTILDHIGAERLLGRGDMLYMPAGSARLQRLHGPLVTEAEIHRVVDFAKKQGKPQYVLSLLQSTEEETDEGLEEDLNDELYDQAVRLVTESGQASISWVQRRLRVGYNRAARMIERMEREGVVSPSDGGRPREVLARRIDDDD
jgi:S-DNA-T family DNA segregation ATPase FtsK/SpoIIIE